ncbi:autotransporter assembly complex family protein [Vibrio splendidus]
MTKIHPFHFLLAVFGFFSAYTNALGFDISGLPLELETNLRYHLTAYEDKEASRLNQRKLHSTVDAALSPYGYYHSQLKVHSVDDQRLSLEVDLGLPTKVATVDVVVSGEASQDIDFSMLLANKSVKEGDALNHQAYDSLKSRLLSLAQRKGYFDGVFTQSKLEVIPSQNIANIRLHFNSGPRYKFGKVTFHQNQIEEDRVRSLNTFEQGDLFETNLVSEFQAQLIKTNWYQGTSVVSNWSTANEKNEVPIDVYLDPKTKNIVQLGAGYSTNLGAKGSLRWQQPWYNARGHSFESKLEVSEPEQSLSLGYKIPTKDVINDYYGVRFESKQVDYLDTNSVMGDLVFEKHWKVDEEWQSTVYLKYLYENYQQASDENETQLMMPGIEFLYQPKAYQPKANKPKTYQPQNLLLKDLKHWHLYSIEYSDPNLLSDSRVLRVTGDSQLAWNITQNQIFAMRSYLGANFSDSIEELPSSLRFFAGGDGSVRGYKYGSISPTDQNGELTGAPFVATLGLDYQARVYKSFWGGIFYDVGDAFDTSPNWNQGLGVSVEWKSKYLHIKLNLAKGVNSEDEYRVHLSFGTKFN